MKMLRDHIIIYDADCPLCRAYTGAFVRKGMLAPDGRQAFQRMDNETEALLDLDRARSEIALVDTRTGQVRYGLQSLMTIIGHAIPVLQPLFRFRPLRWLLQRLYYLVSYNRKIIAAVTPSANARMSCNPPFNLKYRILYLLLSWVFTSFILQRYSGLLEGLIPASSFGREFMICGGQILFQGAMMGFLRRELLLEYLGHMMTVSLMGALFLLPLLLLSPLLPAAPLAYAAYFMGVVAFMLYEHMRRMRLLGLGLVPSMSWVTYRVLLLALMLVVFS